MSEVLLIGAGGIGCAAALGLASGGAQRLTVIDDDVVDASNLHRQVLHTEASVGEPKVWSLARTLERRFPSVRVTAIRGRFDAHTAPALVASARLLLDGSDNLTTKFLANDAAILGARPLVHAAAVGLGGQLLVVPALGKPCYRCLFEELPAPDADAPSCAEAGVLGPVPGVLGALAAALAMRILRGGSSGLSGRLIRYDSPLMTLRSITFRANPTCRVCGLAPDITSLSEGTNARAPESA